MAKENRLVGDQKWPESIDFDQDSNLYFTDAIEKDLFQITMNGDSTHGKGEALFVPMIWGITSLWGSDKMLEIPHIQESIQSQ